MTQTQGMERELLDRAGKGDRAAFGELYDRHHAVVWRFVVHRLGSGTIAEDIVHDTFMELLKNPNRFEPDRGVAFETFLCAIAENLIRKHRRRLANEVPFEVMEKSDPSDMGKGMSFEHQANRTLDLNKASQTLPERQREVLRLSDTEDLTLQEIVDSVGASLPAVKSLLFRAREGMKRFLNPNPRKPDL